MCGKFEKFPNLTVMVTCGLRVQKKERIEPKVLERVENKMTKDKRLSKWREMRGQGGSRDH